MHTYTTTYTKTIITLFGVRGSGKDTIGNMLAERHGFMKESFAAPLKEMVKIAFPDFTDEDLYGPSSRRSTQYPQYPMGEDCVRCNGPLWSNTEGGLSCTEPRCIDDYPLYVSPRIALQTLGTEWGRRLYKNVWVDAAFRRIDLYIQTAEDFLEDHLSAAKGSQNYRHVITDGRFVNEHARAADMGSHTVLLLRGLEESTDTHPSEAEIKTIPREKFSHIVDNRGDLSELPRLVDEMLSKLCAT